jgi:hypothetical protein
MSRTRTIALLAAVAMVGACTHSKPEQESSETDSRKSRSGQVVIAEAESPVNAVYAAGDRVFGLPGQREEETLEASINTLLIGALSPAVVRDPNGTGMLAYNSWGGQGPVLRIRDLALDEESILDEGASSLAWRQDGMLAYFKGLQRRLDPRRVKRYLGHVVVRSSPDAKPERWTQEPGRYVIAAWAGERLLAYRVTKAWPDLLVLDGPGVVRRLARAGALVALSPDGERAFVSTYGAEPPVVRVLDVASGEEAARLTFDEAGGELARLVTFLTEAGSWSGDIVVAKASPGLAVFEVRGERIVLKQILRFDASTFPLGVFEPVLDASGGRIVAWGQLERRPEQAVADAVVLECDRFTLRCRQGPPVSSGAGPRLVYDPSRP